VRIKLVAPLPQPRRRAGTSEQDAHATGRSASLTRAYRNRPVRAGYHCTARRSQSGSTFRSRAWICEERSLAAGQRSLGDQLSRAVAVAANRGAVCQGEASEVLCQTLMSLFLPLN
jgi:hypothetical protein